MKRYFTFRDDKSDKFWSVEVQNSKITVVFGRMGLAGTTTVKILENEAAAEKDAERLIREKVKKGYVEKAEEQAGKFGELEFWNLIERAKSKAEDTYEQVEILTELLSNRNEDDIVKFGKIFQKLYTNSYKSDLWAAAYIINGGCSDDGFDYFRGWLIAQGKDVYYNSLDNPEYLARIIKADDMGEIECEDMLSVAENAYVARKGRGSEEFMELVPNEPYPEIEIDWSEEGDDLKNRFPKLWKKFGEE